MLNKISFAEALNTNSYPGRGIMLGKDQSGEHAVIAYFIMGRSVNSRNRVFVEDGCGIKTKAFDESKLSDPSLIIYAPVRVLGDTTIVTNGDQTDTIYDTMKAGGDFAEALRTRCFEPDGPNWTPRISGTVKVANGEVFYKMSILKAGDAEGSFCSRYTYEYPGCAAGEGMFLHTYKCDGNPIPSFEGEPERVDVIGDIDEFTNLVWENLNPDNKVSLFVRYIRIKDGACETRIINKNK